MNIKMTVITSAVLAGISTLAIAADPPAAPNMYDFGPSSPLVATTDLSKAEKAAYALYEGVMQVAEARVHAHGCKALTADVTAFANGADPTPNNFVAVSSNSSFFQLVATLPPELTGFGQKVVVTQPEAGSLAKVGVSRYSADVFYNSKKNMMVSDMSVSVVGINGRNSPDAYSGRVIKDFYRGSLDSSNKDYYTIFDWGLQSISKLGYPVEKYWQRSKSRRDNGGVGRTVFVKDRLVGANACRITLDTEGNNNADYFWQDGTLKIESALPTKAVLEFNEIPFN